MMKKVLFVLSFMFLAACAHDQDRDVASANDQQCYAGDSCKAYPNDFVGHFVGHGPGVR